MRKTTTTCLFVDSGGVLLTNGWDHHACKRAATQVAQGFGIRGILHMDHESTRTKLASFELQTDDGVLHEIS